MLSTPDRRKVSLCMVQRLCIHYSQWDSYLIECDYNFQLCQLNAASSSNLFTSISKEQTPLNEHNHSVLLKQLQTHSAKWREIGSFLGFCSFELNEIQARPPLWSGGPRSFLNAMLADWLQWAPGDSRGSTMPALPCWRTLKLHSMNQDSPKLLVI